MILCSYTYSISRQCCSGVGIYTSSFRVYVVETKWIHSRQYEPTRLLWTDNCCKEELVTQSQNIFKKINCKNMKLKGFHQIEKSENLKLLVNFCVRTISKTCRGTQAYNKCHVHNVRLSLKK